MKRYIILGLLVVCALAGCFREVPPLEIYVSARSAMIVEAKSEKVLFEKNADERLQPASTVKIMTAVIAMEMLPLESRIIPTGSITRVEPVNAGLEPGVQYSLKDLISAMLIKSANDAAVAVAEGVSGSEEAFVRLMNRKAKDIGMEDTNFTNASGLPAGNRSDQYTTAGDLVKMMRHALKYRFLLEIMSKKEADIYGSDNKRIHFRTHNRSLFFEEHASWGKTGYTVKAGRTFVGVDPSYRPRIIFAFLRSSSLWNDIAVLKNQGLKIYKKRHGNIFKWGQRLFFVLKNRRCP